MLSLISRSDTSSPEDSYSDYGWSSDSDDDHLFQPTPVSTPVNSPDLSLHMDAAWDALRKDMDHGAVLSCNLQRDGKPWVVSPVRTAPKGWRTGKRRFVINMRFLNRRIPDTESTCSLDTLSRIRNLLTFPGAPDSPAWGITMDLASGYHNFWISRHLWTYMGFAFHRSELLVEAIEHLQFVAPECEDDVSGNLYFLMRALGFGFAPSARALYSPWSQPRSLGQSTPERAFLAADWVAVHLWGSGLSFDRQASHLNAMPPRSLGRPPCRLTPSGTSPGCRGSTCSSGLPILGKPTSTSYTLPPLSSAVSSPSSRLPPLGRLW